MAVFDKYHEYWYWYIDHPWILIQIIIMNQRRQWLCFTGYCPLWRQSCQCRYAILLLSNDCVDECLYSLDILWIFNIQFSFTQPTCHPHFLWRSPYVVHYSILMKDWGYMTGHYLRPLLRPCCPKLAATKSVVALWETYYLTILWHLASAWLKWHHRSFIMSPNCFTFVSEATCVLN